MKSGSQPIDSFLGKRRTDAVEDADSSRHGSDAVEVEGFEDGEQVLRVDGC
jgi:hypothetical protein